MYKRQPVVAALLTWTAIRALTEQAKTQAVRRPAMLVIWLLMTQLLSLIHI